MKKYPLSLFIGRFQPFHNGHLYSLRKAVEIGEKVIVGIGSTQGSGTENNPYAFELRRKMVLNVLGDTGLRVDDIVPIPDFPKDEDWAAEVGKIAKVRGYKNDEVIIVGNNDWTNRVLREIGFKVYESGLYNRDELEGVKIREMMRRGDERWQKRVPKAVVDYCSGI